MPDSLSCTPLARHARPPPQRASPSGACELAGRSSERVDLMSLTGRGQVKLLLWHKEIMLRAGRRPDLTSCLCNKVAIFVVHRSETVLSAAKLTDSS
eukprot:752854-Hanusia_phi.AAC.4